MYEHSDIPFTLEFPHGPLAVGDDTIERWDTLQEGDRVPFRPCLQSPNRRIGFVPANDPPVSSRGRSHTHGEWLRPFGLFEDTA
jgi:hypothetical protein